MQYIKLSTILLFLLSVISGCVKEGTIIKVEEFDPTKSFTLTNISYGSHEQQKLDLYLPANRSKDSTKVFILIHGGGWSAGDKADFNDLFNGLKSSYPDHAVMNLNYQLATLSSPGYPKQINDIEKAIAHIQLSQYDLGRQYFLFGASAGAHLSMLYAYAFDPSHDVKAICNTVGPSDLTDTAYVNHPEYEGVLKGLVGNVTFAQNPALYAEVSPAKRVGPSAPITLSFYGSADPLIPVTQLSLLQKALDDNHVASQSTMYAGDGHANWSPANAQDYLIQIIQFIEDNFK